LIPKYKVENLRNYACWAKYVEARTKDFRLVITSPNYSTVVFTDPSIDHSSHFCGVIISKKFNMTVGGSKKPM